MTAIGRSLLAFLTGVPVKSMASSLSLKMSMHTLASSKLRWILALVVGFGGQTYAETGTNRFGFSGPEIFPIDPHITQIRAADLNGDKKLDLVLVNNSRAKINLLFNQTGNTNIQPEKKIVSRRELNELPPDSRFRIESIASEKRIAALVVEDLNSDGKADLAYYGGDPKEIVVQYNTGTNTWSTPKRWQIGDETSMNPNSLTSGDLNGDNKVDLLLLAENHVYLLHQSKDNTLGEPEKLPFYGVVKSVQVLDINGDGRDDMLFVNWDDPNPFRFRLQNSAGHFGPEFHYSLPAIRSYWADDLDRDKKTEVISIAQNSGRSQVSNFVLKDADVLSGDFKQGQFQVTALNKTGKARRGILWADINTDGLADLLVAEPDSGQLTLHLQNKDGSLATSKTFPTFTGVSDLAAADWDKDGKPEIFVLSQEERQIGITRYDDKGRIAFPTVLPLEGKPLAMAVGAIRSNGPVTLSVISELETNRVLSARSSTGKVTTQKLSDTFKSNPSSMTLHDADQDGLTDLIILIPYEKIKILRQVADKDFEEQDIVPPGGNADQPWLSMSDVDGDGKSELLLAQKNFLRAVSLKTDGQTKDTNNKPAWSFIVKEQINGSSSSSRIVAATPVKNSTNSVDSLFLLDSDKKSLTLCERDGAGVWQVVRNVPLPATDFSSMQSIGFGTQKPNSVAFVGVNAVGWMNLGGKVWEFTELDSYETPIKDGRLNDVISGDLNNDNRMDLVFLETAKNYVDLVLFEPPNKLVPANRWPVFEERTFRSRRSELPEPREALITDVTGDGKNDLIVLVHDRILMYPQE